MCKDLKLEDIEVDVTSSQLLLSEELAFLRNSINSTNISSNNSSSPAVISIINNGSNSSNGNDDNEKIRSMQAENNNLKLLLSQAKLDISKNGVSNGSSSNSGNSAVTEQLATQLIEYKEELNTLKKQILDKNLIISQQETKISTLLENNGVTSSSSNDNKQNLEKEINNLNKEITKIKLEFEKSNIDYIKKLSEHTMELTRVADMRVNEVEVRLETEKEEMMDAMAQEVSSG